MLVRSDAPASKAAPKEEAVAAIGIPVAAVVRSAEFTPLVALTATTSACVCAAITAVLAVPDGWLTPSVRDLVGQARKYGFETVASARRRYRFGTI